MTNDLQQLLPYNTNNDPPPKPDSLHPITKLPILPSDALNFKASVYKNAKDVQTQVWKTRNYFHNIDSQQNGVFTIPLESLADHDEVDRRANELFNRHKELSSISKHKAEMVVVKSFSLAGHWVPEYGVTVPADLTKLEYPVCWEDIGKICQGPVITAMFNSNRAATVIHLYNLFHLPLRGQFVDWPVCVNSQSTFSPDAFNPKFNSILDVLKCRAKVPQKDDIDQLNWPIHAANEFLRMLNMSFPVEFSGGYRVVSKKKEMHCAVLIASSARSKVQGMCKTVLGASAVNGHIVTEHPDSLAKKSKRQSSSNSNATMVRAISEPIKLPPCSVPDRSKIKVIWISYKGTTASTPNVSYQLELDSYDLAVETLATSAIIINKSTEQVQKDVADRMSEIVSQNSAGKGKIIHFHNIYQFSIV